MPFDQILMGNIRHDSRLAKPKIPRADASKFSERVDAGREGAAHCTRGRVRSPEQKRAIG
jgi:hypothetical protein